MLDKNRTWSLKPFILMIFIALIVACSTIWLGYITFKSCFETVYTSSIQSDVRGPVLKKLDVDMLKK